VQYGYRDDESTVEPVRHVDVLDAPLRDRGEEDNGEGNPDDRYQQVDRPFELGVLLGLCDSERQRNGGQHNDQLPSPEGERGEFVEGQPHMAGSLHHVVGSCKQRGATEREDHGVGMQRPEAAVCEERKVKVELRPDQLGGDHEADQHADDAPDYDHERELTHNRIVVRSCFVQGKDPCVRLDFRRRQSLEEVTTTAPVAPAVCPPKRPRTDPEIYQDGGQPNIGDDTYGIDSETNVQIAMQERL